MLNLEEFKEFTPGFSPCFCQRQQRHSFQPTHRPTHRCRVPRLQLHASPFFTPLPVSRPPLHLLAASDVFGVALEPGAGVDCPGRSPRPSDPLPDGGTWTQLVGWMKLVRFGTRFGCVDRNGSLTDQLTEEQRSVLRP